MIALYCAANGLSERQVAGELGLSVGTFNRVMRGHEVTVSRLMPILTWMLGTRKNGL
jgi:transcriptional regulator with XRE-family HTH domain